MPRRLSFTRLSLAQQPLVFLTTAFLCGLLWAAHYHTSVRIWLSALAVIWASCALCLWLQRAGRVVTMLLLCGCFVGGSALWTLNEASVSNQRVRRIFERGELRVDEPCEVWGTLDAMPELAPDRIYLSIAVERVATLGKEQAASGGVWLVVPFQEEQARRDYDALQLDYGVRVRLLTHLDNRSGYRNPGAPQFDEMLEYRGYDASGWVKSPLLIEPLGVGRRNGWLWRLYRWRAQALSVILRSFKQPAAGILAAALLGNRYFLARDTAQTFRDGGTFHLLVISGLHVALLAGVLLWLTRWLKWERVWQYALVIALLWAYGLMVGAQPSIMRAVVMITLALIGQLLFRTALGANTLAASAQVLLIWQPRDLFNPAFQLSFLTVLAIVTLAAPVYQRAQQIGVWQPTATTPYPPRVPRIVRWFSEVLFWDERGFQQEKAQAHLHYSLVKARSARWLNRSRLQPMLAWVVTTVFTTVCVQLALLPLMIVHFHRFSLVSPMTNVVEGILIFLLMLVGALHLAVYACSAWLAAWLSPLVSWLGEVTVKAGQPPLAWPLASVRVPDWGAGAVWVYAGFFALILLAVLLINEWNPLRKGDDAAATRRKWLGRIGSMIATGGIACLSWLLIAHPFLHRFERGRLSVTFLDVGQGDAIFISFPQGRTLLLDSGGRLGYALKQEQAESEPNEDIFIEDRIGVGEAAVLPFLWQLGLKRLDYVAATHGDSDHTEGFGEVMKALAVGEAWTNITLRAGERLNLFTRAVHERGLSVRALTRGTELMIDGTKLTVLAPFNETGAGQLSDNNLSLVLRLALGKRVFLLTGDIERVAEARLLTAQEDLRADVLKVAHHGSRTSTTAEFLASVKPTHAVISVADPSPFGHPHSEVVARLHAVGAKLWQTGQCGAITFTTDGADLQVATFAKCAH
jgi:competence protein ComEC